MLHCILLSSLEKAFPDKAPADPGFSGFSLLQGEYGAFQIAVFSDTPQTLPIRVQSDLTVRVYRVDCVPAGLICHTGDDDYLRKESGLYPDLLRPCETIEADETIRALWFEVEAGTAAPGLHTVEVTVGACTRSVQVEVIDAVLPPQTLVCTHWFHTDCLHTYYDVPVFSEAYWRITENFVRAAAEHGVNMLYTPLFTPPLDTAEGRERPTVQLVDVTKTGDKYVFGFEKLRRWIEMGNRCGMRYFEFSHFFTQWGAKHAPKIMAQTEKGEKQIFGWKTAAGGRAYTAFLRAFAPALRVFLETEKLTDRCWFHVSDEPSSEALTAYRRRSALVRELFPGYPVMDALSDFDFYARGLVQQPIPCINTVEDFYGKVPQLWTYYCCGPEKGGYPNRFIGMPSRRCRILGLLMYRYDIRGFLQWGFNFWYSQLSDHPIDPLQTTDADGAFPAGDPFVLYPGADGEALVSLRFKVFRDALQDLRALQLLESRIGRERTLALLCGEETLTMQQYPRTDAWLLAKREEINRAIAASREGSA